MSTNSKGPQGDTAPLDAPSSLEGRTLDREYRLHSMIKVGGMGAIFEAEQLSTNRRVAIKVLKPSKNKDADLVRRFEREADVLTKLSHPNIVTLIDAGRDAGGLSYVVMEYVEGATFREVLDDGSLTLLEIVDVFSKVVSALAEAHEKNVVHRDLKFENVMISRQADGHLRVTVLDFGVAKPMSDPGALELTQKGQVPGTPLIIAPELLDEHPPSPRSDLYSLGVLLYTALAGDPPFQAKHELELMRAHTTQPVPDLHARAALYVPDDLVDLAETLLEKDPEDRPRHANAVLERLESVRRRLWKLPVEDYPYEPGDEGPERLRKAIAESDRPDDPGDTDEENSWVRAVFGDPD